MRSVFRAAVADRVIGFGLRRLTVSRQLQRDGDTSAVRLPKYGSERIVHLPDDLVAMLRDHVDRFLPDVSRATPRAAPRAKCCGAGR